MHRRWTATSCALAIGLAGMVGCQGSGVEDRLHQLEQRVRALESTPAEQRGGATPHGVTADVLSLERRLAALEQRIGTVEKAASAASPAPGVSEMRLDQRRERRARLRQVTDEYRARLATIRQTETDPTARQQAVRDALAWYREQRRAILAGDAPAPAP